jgi:predicted CoA-substrate-specific enzyme activase
MITLGCDIGSLFSKAVILDGDRVTASQVVRTTGNVGEEIEGLLRAVIRQAGLKREQVACVVATGNGADLVKDADRVEDVVTCVGAAAGYYLPEVRLSIDVGGQSTTSMLLDEDGEIRDFMRNDKCAAGSGRFLEVMALKLGVKVAEIDQTAARAQKTIELSSQCGVFAESEVITHLNNGEPMPDIIAGVCASVAKMVLAQGRRFGTADHFTLTGGVAKLQAVTRIIREKLGGTFHPFPHDPQLATAIGAALLGSPD